MADMLEDGISLMVDTLLEQCPTQVSYACRFGNSPGQLIAHKRPERSVRIEVGAEIIEVRYTDFLFRTSDLVATSSGIQTFIDPKEGDRIIIGWGSDFNAETYEVRPLGDEPCFRRMANAMTRIHTDRVCSN